jgi:hypothetical protein
MPRPTERSLDNLRRTHADSAAQSRRRLNQIAHEQAQADRLRADGYEVFSPTVVCDRIAVKAGRVYFVEFKKHGQQLRDGQATIQALVPSNYLVVYSA